MSSLRSATAANVTRTFGTHKRVIEGRTVFCVCLLALCVGLGAMVSSLPAVPLWELAMLVVLVGGVLAWVTVGATHPLAWMCTLYAAYFLMGVQNWVEPSSALGFRGYVSAEPTLKIAVIGISFFAVGVMSVTGFKRVVKIRPQRVPPLLDGELAGKVLLGVGAVGLGATFAKFGIPITNISISAKASHGIWALLTYAIVPGALLATINCRSVRRDLVIIGVCDLALVLLAYRSPVILLTGCFLLFRLLQRHLRQRTVILASIGLAVFAVGIFAYRLEASGKTLVNQNVKPTGPFVTAPALFPLYIGFSREGVSVLARLQAIVPSYTQYFDGRVQISMFRSLFHSTSPRQYVYDVAYGTEVAQTTLTPTIVGGPYLDFGLLGVAGEMMVIGLISGALYMAAIHTRFHLWWTLSFSYWTTLVIMGIHTGLLDATTLLLVPGMAVVAFAVARAVREPQIW